MARRIPGEFVPSDVNLVSDPDIMRAGALAELLFRRANEHAKRNNRDGIIYAMELPIVANGIPGAARKHAEALVREGLWEERCDGWLIRSFLKWNLSQAEIAVEKEARRVGAIKTNHKRNHRAEKDDYCPICRGEMAP
jgi:hypothetical protein